MIKDLIPNGQSIFVLCVSLFFLALSVFSFRKKLTVFNLEEKMQQRRIVYIISFFIFLVSLAIYGFNLNSSSKVFLGLYIASIAVVWLLVTGGVFFFFNKRNGAIKDHFGVQKREDGPDKDEDVSISKNKNLRNVIITGDSNDYEIGV